ncbi:formylmethanofuran dehydrogenase subunit C [Mariniblastus fucicola]|uniref:Formyltransferase/hydrolase complex Fhc subunit C n=1 Tax=Mariniblastus fucicola TaxID=980251 RepID=A0A5B9P5P0_9BACT|nr:formylmethanofuran dehydrogenase subunit C [Mariniblastus fucicola]QEG21708.1 Formyltransferase/hydrolase complex Fhc subunit C [Mariniblastus fucicola]
MPILFELKSKPGLPLDVRNLVPDSVKEMTPTQIGNLEIGLGNRSVPVSQWFDVSGESGDAEVVFQGSLENVHAIGHSMSCGKIEVRGSTGRHVGASMSGGEIVVDGDVSDYPGYEMQGGTIVVRGDAGDHVGGCYPGAKYGMNRGVILIAGSAGKGLGYRMRRGTIVVGGDVADHTAWQMRAGTIIVFGKCSGWVGVDMRRGTIIVQESFPMPQTFAEGPQVVVPVVAMLDRWLAGVCDRYGISVPSIAASSVRTWHGDALAGGRGELLVAMTR